MIFDEERAIEQKSRRDRFQDRFEIDERNGSYVLTALGCMKRYDMPRSEIDRSPEENAIGIRRYYQPNDNNWSWCPEEYYDEMMSSLTINGKVVHYDPETRVISEM